MRAGPVRLPAEEGSRIDEHRSGQNTTLIKCITGHPRIVYEELRNIGRSRRSNSLSSNDRSVVCRCYMWWGGLGKWGAINDRIVKRHRLHLYIKGVPFKQKLSYLKKEERNVCTHEIVFVTNTSMKMQPRNSNL